MTTALLVIDCQNDFFPRGSLAVSEANKIIDPIRKLAGEVDLRIFTSDWHIKDHPSFKENGGLWPAHCVAGTKGAMIVSALADIAKPDGNKIYRIYKGTNCESYSAAIDSKGNHTGLIDLLREEEVDIIYVTGVATEYCVLHTVLDLLKWGFTTVVVEDAIKGIEPEAERQALDKMFEAGAVIQCKE